MKLGKLGNWGNCGKLINESLKLNFYLNLF